MGTRLLMLCLWIISTFVIADNLSDADNKERAKKCGVKPQRLSKRYPHFKPELNSEFLSIPISPRHFIVSSNMIPGYANATCNNNQDFISNVVYPRKIRNITYIGECNWPRGFLLMESTAKPPRDWFACLPTELLGENTAVRAYNKNNKRYDVQTMKCINPSDKLCVNQNIEQYKEFGGPLYQIDGNDTTGKWTIHGTGLWNEIKDEGEESVAVPVFLNLKAICDASGICPVPEATTTETPITTTSEEVTTTPTPPESSTEPPITPPTIPNASSGSTVKLTSRPVPTPRHPASPVPPEINRPDISSTRKPESHRDTDDEEYEEEEDFFVSADFLNGSGKMGLNLIIAVMVMVLIV